jgi:lipopolysaccharide export system protein LptC
MAVRDFMDKLRAPKSLVGPPVSDPRAIFNRRRSRLAWLKFGLPLVAVGIIGVLTYLNYKHQSETVVSIPVVEDMPKLDVGMKVSGIAFEGKSKSDRPFSVTALSATEAKDNKDLIDLEEPQAEIELSAQTWIAVTAEHGIYNRALDKVDLNGAVTVYHDNGLTFSTEQAAMDLTANTASGTKPVTGKDATRELSAEGFEMLDDGATVLFKGRSYLKISPKGKGSGE